MKRCCHCKSVKPAGEFNRNKSKSDGLSTTCRGCSNFFYRQKYRHNRLLYGKLSRKYRTILHIEAEHIYGSVCYCCGETNKMFLTWDHPNNDGASHRKKIAEDYGSNYRQISTEMMLRDLKKRGWPVNANRRACYNCNCGRHRNNGICPHMLEPVNGIHILDPGGVICRADSVATRASATRHG